MAPGALSAPSRLRAPRGFPGAVLAPALVGAFNALRWHAARRPVRGRPTPAAAHFFQLDAVRDWNRLYGSRGFMQYQFAVPTGGEAGSSIASSSCGRDGFRATSPCSSASARVPEPPSFPIEGWTLALDLPAKAPGLRPALDQLDELVAASGGAGISDQGREVAARPPGDHVSRLERFQRQRALVDPDGLLQSDLGRRLGLCATAP